MTKRKALQWIWDHQPVHIFPKSGPSVRMLEKLEQQKLIVRTGMKKHTELAAAMGQYSLTIRGKRLLDSP